MKKALKEEALRTFDIPADFKQAYTNFEYYLKNQAYPNYQNRVVGKKDFNDMKDFFIERCRACMKYYDEIAHYGYLDTTQLTPAENYFLGMHVKDATVAHMQYSSKFLSKLENIQPEVKEYILGFILCFDSELTKLKNKDYHGSTKALSFDLSSSLKFTQHRISTTGKSMVIAEYNERLPELDKNGGIVKLYKYTTTTRMIDIINDTDKKSVENLMIEFYNECRNDPDRLKHPETKTQVKSYRDKEYCSYLTPEEAQQLKYYGAPIFRWAKPQDVKKTLEWTDQVAIAQMNSGILSTLADFESASKLVKILEKIPNFKIKLTSEERKVIGQEGNVLALGRSGTGKTTCAVLRLFSQDMLFKIRMKKSSIEMKLKDMRYADNDDSELSFVGIHSIFVTASPVLCNEVSRYYKRLDTKVMEEIEKRRNSAKKLQGDQNEENKNEKEIEITTEKKVDQEEAKPENENLEEIDENEYLMDEDEAEAMTLMNKNVNLVQIEDKEFPLFLTVRRLVLMIDGTLSNPFFARDKNHEILASNTRAQWHNEMKGAMLINNRYRGKDKAEEENKETEEAPEDELVEAPEDFGKDDVDELTEDEIEAEYERYQAILSKRNALSTEKTNKQSLFEIDYEYFANHFWPANSAKFNKKVSPLLVWSEFNSTIKGSSESFSYEGKCMPETAYLNLSVEGSILNKDNRAAIYKTFLDYKEWKKNIGGYDFMDVVNHALHEIHHFGYNGAPIHFIMIDEVQDLSHATINLLLKVTEQGVFFAGDTAQTIAKGVGVRFSDLRSLFKGQSLPQPSLRPPTVHQLTVNFRSHGKILDIANSVVSLVEAFFPETIDKLKKEKSEIDGPKPILLDGVELEVLFALLFGTENYKSIRQSQSAGGLLDKPPIEFGCNQVIIVRDQEAKENLPSILKHALCLTVYEAKGLEFDQVILYNFFSDSKVSAEEWKLIEDALIETRQATKQTFENYFFTYKDDEDEDLNSLDIKSTGEQDPEKLNKNDVNLFNSDFDTKTGMYNLKRVTLSKKFYGKDMSNFSLICNELKQLYVALTRPRNRIIIYDDNVYKRTHLESYWKELNLVQVITKNILEEPEKTDTASSNKEVSSFKALITSTGASEWKLQGLKMFRNKFYSQAYKCFEHSGDAELAKRCKAYMLAEQAADKMAKINAEKSFITEGVQMYAGMSIRDRNKCLKKVKVQELEQYDVYLKAAEMFVEIGLPKHAGRCYFSALNYQKSMEIFEEAGMFREAGEACWMLKDYLVAGDLFSKGKDYMRAIECFEKSHNYDKLLQTIDLYTDLPPKDKKILANKYVPLALKSLTEKVEFQEEGEKPKNDDVIEEDDSEDDDEVEESQVQQLVKEAKKEDFSKDVDEISFDKISNKDASEKLQEITLSEIPVSVKKEEQKVDKALSEISFVDVAAKSETSSYVKVEEQLDNFEHLSDIDFKDEFLKVETGSVIESIASLRKKKSEISSDFSAVGFNQYLATDFHLVKTKVDIFIQDDVMNKIIKYVERFYDEFMEDLNQVKATRALLSNQATSINPLSENYMDFDNITKEFLFFILDFLEKNNLHKLCIFVCNRYNLADKLGRYLCNLAFKYSPFTTEGRNPTSAKLYNPRFSKILQEKGFVANLAVHNILEIINPAYISFKKKDEPITDTNSLDTMSLFKLISLGFWKKVVYILDYENALALSSAFASFDSYKRIYLSGHPSCEELIKSSNIETLIKQNDFEFLPFKTPENKDEIELAIAALDSVVWGINEKFPVNLYKDYNPESHRGESLTVPAFPSYLAYNGILWDYVINKKPEMKEKFVEYLLSACDNLEKILGSKEFKSEVIDLRIYDIVSFLTHAIILYQTNHTVSDAVNSITIDQLIKVMVTYKSLLTYVNNLGLANRHADVILRAYTSPFRVRDIPMTSVLKNLGGFSYIVHKGSPLIDDFITKPETLMMDVEGNFMITPREYCLRSIRRRVLIRLKLMIYSRVQGSVASLHPESSVSEFASVVEFKKTLEQQAKLIGLICTYDYCHSLHYGPNLFKKKPKPMYANTEEQPEDDEYEEMELGDIRRKKVQSRNDSYRNNNRRILLSVEEPEMITKISTNETDYPFITYKYNLVKSFLSKLNSYIGIRLSLDKYTKNYLTEIAMKKLNSNLAKGKIKPKIINMFHILGKDLLLTDKFLKAKDEVVQDLSLYHDSIYYRIHGCSEDYFYNMVSFLRNSLTSIKIESLFPILENLTTNLVMARAVYNNLKEIYVPKALSLTLDMVRKVENDIIFDKNITPMKDKETFDDYISFLSEVADQIRELDPESLGPCAQKLVRLCNSLIINDLGFTDACTNSLHYCFSFASEVDIKVDLKEVLSLKSPFQFKNYAENFKANAQKASNVPVLGLMKDSIITIKIKSDPKQAAKNQEISETAYNKDMWKIGKLINLKISLRKLKKKSGLAKIIPKRLENPFKTSFIQRAILSSTLQSLKTFDLRKLFAHSNFYLELFARLSQNYDQISKFLATNYHFNTFEYTYVLDLLMSITQLASDLQESVAEVPANRKFEISTVSDGIIAKITQIMMEYEQWWSTRNQNSKEASKLTQNLKLTRLKWQEEAFMLRMQKIAKKRRAIIKRDMLRDKAIFKKN